MHPIDDMLTNLRNLSTTAIYAAMDKIVAANKQTIINWNTKDQLFNKGENALSTKIRPLDKDYPVYSEQYEEIKREAGKYQGYVDLSFSGKLHDSWQLIISPRSYTIMAGKINVGTYDLAEILRERYGEEIEGLNFENLGKFIDLIRVNLIPEIKKMMFNGV